MARILSQPTHLWAWQATCHKCHALSEFDHDDLRRAGFKKDPGTYWFDGSAVAVLKYYVHCPNGCDIIFVPGDVVNAQLAQYVRDSGREEPLA